MFSLYHFWEFVRPSLSCSYSPPRCYHCFHYGFPSFFMQIPKHLLNASPLSPGELSCAVNKKQFLWSSVHGIMQWASRMLLKRFFKHFQNGDMYFCSCPLSQFNPKLIRVSFQTPVYGFILGSSYIPTLSLLFFCSLIGDYEFRSITSWKLIQMIVILSQRSELILLTKVPVISILERLLKTFAIKIIY